MFTRLIHTVIRIIHLVTTQLKNYCLTCFHQQLVERDKLQLLYHLIRTGKDHDSESFNKVLSSSDNKTIAPHFVKKRLEDCHMDLYWYCQEGEELIKSITNLQFSDGKKFTIQL